MSQKYQMHTKQLIKKILIANGAEKIWIDGGVEKAKFSRKKWWGLGKTLISQQDRRF